MDANEKTIEITDVATDTGPSREGMASHGSCGADAGPTPGPSQEGMASRGSCGADPGPTPGPSQEGMASHNICILTNHATGHFPSLEGQGWVDEGDSNNERRFLAKVKEVILLGCGLVLWLQPFEVSNKIFQYFKYPVGIEEHLFIGKMQNSHSQLL